MNEQIKCVIFFGQRARRADDQFNEWSADNPTVDIREVQYQHTDSEHSICVFYVEEE